MRNRVLLAAAPLALLTACNQAPAPADPAAVMDEVHKAEQALLADFAAKDLDGATSVYAEDAQFFATGGPVVSGADNIRAAFEAMLKDPLAKVAIVPGKSWVSAGGDLAVSTGTFTYTYTGPDGKAASMSGPVQTVWQKQADGAWKLVSDFNAEAPAAAQAEPAASEAPAAEATPEEATTPPA